MNDQDSDKQYRVFISYSRRDSDMASRIEAILNRNGMMPMRDKSFAAGSGFHNQIRTYIAHSHVFLPIITKNSARRNWVQQEIGYAMAINVPVLPVVAPGKLPEGMPSQLQALQYRPGSRSFQDSLSVDELANLVRRSADDGHAPFHCAEFHEDRSILMARYANEVIALGYSGCVRQRGGLSSFHIPDANLSADVWKRRYGSLSTSSFHHRELRKERRTLVAHAMEKGFRIIIDPCIAYNEFGSDARRIRVATLIEFLKGLDDEKTDGKYQVAFHGGMRSQNTTIVGDWFAAETVSRHPDEGYLQTIFTRHAPSMQNRIDLFDQDLRHRLEIAGWAPEESRRRAVDCLKKACIDCRPANGGPSAGIRGCPLRKYWRERSGK